MYLQSNKVLKRLFILTALIGCLITLTSVGANAAQTDECCAECATYFGECISSCSEGTIREQIACVRACARERNQCVSRCPTSCN